MGEKLVCRKYQKKFVFNNLLHLYYKSNFYRRKIIKFKDLSKNKKLMHKSILIKKSFIIKKLKLVKLKTFLIFLNEMFFCF